MGRGAQVSRRPFSQAIEEAELRGKRPPEWVSRYLRESPDLELIEVSGDAEPYFKPDDKSEEAQRMHLSETVFRILMSFLDLSDVFPLAAEAWHFNFRFLPPALLIGAAAFIYGDQALSPHFMVEMCSLDELRDLKSKVQWPVYLSPCPSDLHGARNVPPYVAAIHDLHHILRAAKSGLAVQRDTIVIYDCLKRIPDQILPVDQREVLRAEILNGPVPTHEDPYSSIFRGIQFELDRPLSEEAIRLFREELRTAFQGHPEKDRILAGFEKRMT